MRHFAVSALLLSLAIPAAAPAQAPGAASLLALHRQYVGWQLGDNKVSSIRSECTTTNAGGAVQSHVTEQRIGMAYRDDVVSDNGRLSNGFTGNIFWRTGDSGFTTPVIGVENKPSLAFDTVFAEGTTQLSATLTGSATVDGKTYDVLRTTMADEPMDLYVDPATGAYARVVIDPGGEQQNTIDIDAYTEAAPGIRVLSAYHVDGSDERYACSSVRINAAIALDALAPSPSTATWTFANDQPIPIHISHHQVIIDAQVNGVPGQFMLDTSNSPIMLSDAFAARAHVSVSGPAIQGALTASRAAEAGQAYGIGGIVTMHHGRAQSITVGGNTLSNIAVTTIDKDMTELQTPTEPLQHIDGLLGFDFLAGALVDLNLANNTMRIRDPNVVQPDPNAGMLLVVDLSDGTPVIPMKIDGTIDTYAMLDSGYDGSVFFARDLIWNYGLKIAYDDTSQNVLMQYTMENGSGGIVAERCGHLDSVSLGPITYQFMQACESRDLHGRNMIVGWDFFKHFNYVFDYPRAVIQVMPNGNTQS